MGSLYASFIYSGGKFFAYFLFIWLSIPTSFHTDMAFAPGQEAVTRIWIGEYPSSFQTSAHMFCALSERCVFSFQPNSNIIFAFRQIMSHHEFLFSLSYFLVSKSIILPEKNVTFLFNTILHGKKFFHYLIVPKSSLLLHGFSLTPSQTFLI